MKERFCVYTCIAGDYDGLSEIAAPEKNIDYLCFTNNKNLKSKTWKIIYINNGDLDNHHLSRKIKMLGHPIVSNNYDVSIWMDASVVWKKNISDFIDKYYKNQSFSAIKHSLRNSVHEEAITCLRLHKDSKTNILRTLSFLESEDFPDNLGLYEMTVFIKKHNDPTVIKAMELWFKMNQEYSKRDQLSFTYIAWKTNLPINIINLNIWNNPWFANRSHKIKALPPSLGIYFGNPNNNFNYNNFQNCPPSTDGKLFSVFQKIPNDCKTIYIDFPHARGLICEKIKTSPPIDHYEIANATIYNKDYIFLSGDGIIILHGNFVKGEAISFSIKLKQIDYDDLIKFTETLAISINNNNHIKEENEILKKTNKSLKKELTSQAQTLESIKSSKSWRIIQKIKKFLPPYKR